MAKKLGSWHKNAMLQTKQYTDKKQFFLFNEAKTRKTIWIFKHILRNFLDFAIIKCLKITSYCSVPFFLSAKEKTFSSAKKIK